MAGIVVDPSLHRMDSHLHLALATDDDNGGPSAPSPIRVLLADDHPSVRRSMRGLLDDEAEVEVVGEADDLRSVERQLQTCRPDVLVLDLGMQDHHTGIEAIGRLRERAPKTMIVSLTMQDEPAFAHHALSAGAMGFVSKELADTELAPAIRAAACGERYVSPRVAARLEARRHAAA